MSNKERTIENLSVDDLNKHPVWEFTGNDKKGELTLKPVEKIPVKTLDKRIVGTEVQLHNGTKVIGILGNVSVESRQRTQHFLTLSIVTASKRFVMARYHDHDWKGRGPDQLAEFLGLRVEDVFPISYNLTSIAVGDQDVLAGTIVAEPAERLTRSELIALAASN